MRIVPPRHASPNWHALRPLIQRRHSLDVTQAEIGRYMGTHGSNVCKAESGAIPISSQWVARYAAALDAIERATVELREGLAAAGYRGGQ